MKKGLLLVLLAVVLVVSLAAFAACKAEEEPPVVEEEEPPVVEEEEPPVVEEEEVVWEWPEKMLVGTASVGGALYGLAVAWTAVFAEDTGVTLRVVAEENEMLRYKWVCEGKLLLCGVDTCGADKTQALGGFAHREYGPAPLAAIWTATYGAKMFCVRGDSHIRTPYDIKPGDRFAIMVGKPMLIRAAKAICAWGEVNYDDVILVPFGTYSACLRSVMDGKADIVFAMAAHATVFEMEAAPHGLHWLEFDAVADPEAAKRYMKYEPYELWGVNTFGVPSSIGNKCPVVTSPLGVARDADPELIYHLTKWLHENWELYKDKHFYCETSMCWEVVRGYLDYAFVPIHDGTIRYLKEIGEWSEADELRNKYNVWLQDWYIKAYQEAIDKADVAGVEVNALNEEWIELWENYKKEIGIPPIASMTDDEITEAAETWGIE